MYEIAIFVLKHEIERIDNDLKHHKIQIGFLETRIKFESIPKYLEMANSEKKDRNDKINNLKAFRKDIITEIELLKTDAQNKLLDNKP